MTEGALGTLVALSYKGDGDDNYRVTRRIDLPVDEIVEAYESGLTTAEVGKLFGVSARPVQRILRDQGTTLRPRNSKATKHLPMDEITSQPSGQRVEDKLSWCRDFLAQYEEWGVA